MLNFVICEDNKKNREKLINIITKIMMPYDFDYIVHEFEDYDNKMNKLINETYEKKIYILDIELPSRSGLDIARKIRTRDWESIIIVCTAYYDLALEAIKNRLMLLDFISKFNNFEERVKTSIELAIKILENKKELILESGNILYKIKYDDIVYIVKDTLERKSIINTVNGEYKVNQNISSIMRSLDARFFQTHRSCIVNKEYIKEIDFKEGKITFDNNEFVYLLARGKKKGLKEYVGISK
jgi:two-component system response regulator AgrA